MDKPRADDPPGTVTNLHDITAKKTTSRKLTEAIGNSQEMLFTASGVFPFTLFPDTIAVDREKVTIANRNFFRTAEIVSVRVEDVLNVTADVGPFFGAVTIHTRFFDPDNHANIRFLRRKDALRLKRILQGYVVATKKDIDCSGFSTKELSQLLDGLGQGHPTMKDM